MKLALTLFFALTTLAPLAHAGDQWETVHCGYRRNRIPDNDSGTWCRHFYACVDQGKRAFIVYRGNIMDRLCCDSRRQNCTDTYGGD